MPLLFTLGTGIFMMIGLLIVFLTNNNRKIVDLSISIAFGVMTMLIFVELLPEAYEKLSEQLPNLKSILLMLGFVIVGTLLLKVLDLFVPDHDMHDQQTSAPENLFHIGLVSSIALILHNIIEGMAIYSTVATNPSMGILVTIGVGLHNIPMGMVVTSTFYQSNSNKKKTTLFVFVIALSTFLGGIIMLFLSEMITSLVLGILLSITLGMLFYIVVFELLEEMVHNHNSKITWIGVAIGIVIFLLTLFFES